MTTIITTTTTTTNQTPIEQYLLQVGLDSISINTYTQKLQSHGITTVQQINQQTLIKSGITIKLHIKAILNGLPTPPITIKQQPIPLTATATTQTPFFTPLPSLEPKDITIQHIQSCPKHHLDDIDKYGNTALRKLTWYYKLQDKYEEIQLLINSGADVNLSDTYYLRSPLMGACRFSQAWLVQLLIQKGAHVNSKDREGWTPLHYCVYGSASVPIFEMLIIAGADYKVKTNNNRTLAQLGDEYRCGETTRKILETILKDIESKTIKSAKFLA
jgi:hypothetical protein